jgi:hypothetical protein
VAHALMVEIVGQSIRMRGDSLDHPGGGAAAEAGA